jgi:hypothetical protein
MQRLVSQKPYAQTNIQLWNQLKEDGYSNNEVAQGLRASGEFIFPLFHRFRKNSDRYT